MTKTLFIIASLSTCILLGCNSGNNDQSVVNDSTKVDSIAQVEKTDIIKKDCPATTNIEVGALKLPVAAFEIKDAWANKISESSIEIYFTNVPRTEMDLNASKLKGKQVKVKVTVTKRDSKPLEPGKYVYHLENDADANYMISEITSKEGITYIFWGSGDPNPGTLEIFDITNDQICGNIQVQTLESETYGQQVIKGDFVVKIE